MVVLEINKDNYLPLTVKDFNYAYDAIGGDAFIATISRDNGVYSEVYNGYFVAESADGNVKTDCFNKVIVAKITTYSTLEAGEYTISITLNGQLCYNGYCKVLTNVVMTEGINGIIIGNGL